MSDIIKNRLKLEAVVLYSEMVRSLDKRWSYFISSVCVLAKQLESLGLTYQDGKVTYSGLENENDV